MIEAVESNKERTKRNEHPTGKVDMKHPENKAAICPFYHGEDKQKVYCEGVGEGITLHVAFATPALAKSYREKYCHNFAYRYCAVCVMLWQKYED